MSDYPMTIGGRQATSAERLPVTDPATGETVGHNYVCTRELLAEAIDAADRAFPEWRADEELRRKSLQAMGDVVDEHVDELGELMTREQGKPLSEARSEVGRSADRFRYWAEVKYDLSEFADASRGLRAEVSLQP